MSSYSRRIKKMAKRGCPCAQLVMAEMHLMGGGSDSVLWSSEWMRKKWLQRVADQGEAGKEYILGASYEKYWGRNWGKNCRGVDYSKAREHYFRAVELGHLLAECRLNHVEKMLASQSVKRPQVTEYVSSRKNSEWNNFFINNLSNYMVYYGELCKKFEMLKEIKGGNIFAIPVFSQNYIAGGSNNGICWATCIAMVAAFHNNWDLKDGGRELVLKITNGDLISGGKMTRANDLKYLNLPQIKEREGTLSMAEVKTRIGTRTNPGNPFGVVYGNYLYDDRDDGKWEGHECIVVGYLTTASGKDYIVSVNPWGMVSLDSYGDFHMIEGEHTYAWRSTFTW